MLPTPTRHLQIQFQQIADASNPNQASANPIPASCRCFQPRPGICKSNSNKLQMLPTPARHLQIQFQQIADASTSGVHPYMYLQIQFQQVADASDPRICICKFISNKLQMLPTPARHLQIQFQQVADASTSGVHPYMHLQIQFQQIADASDPDQASTNPIPASCRCFQPRPGICKSNSSKLQMLPRPEFTPICICKSNSSKLQMLPTPTRHLQIQFQQVADASNPGQASANPIPASCRCFRP